MNNLSQHRSAYDVIGLLIVYANWKNYDIFAQPITLKIHPILMPHSIKKGDKAILNIIPEEII